MKYVFNPVRPPHNCDYDDPRIDEYIDEAWLQERFGDYDEKEFSNESKD